MTTAVTHHEPENTIEATLFVAFELSEKTWKLGFTTGHGQKPRERTVTARQQERVLDEIVQAKRRLGLPETAPVVSCYEAGREGFWLHRFLQAHGITNQVVDSSSIEVNRRRRRAKSDGLDVRKLLSMLMRYHMALTMVITHQHAQQFAHVQPIALGSTTAPVDLNGGGIHHMVGDPVPLQKPMQPEAFATRFIATDHCRCFRQTQAAFGLDNFVEHALLLPCGHGALARLLPMARGEAELQGFFTQCKGHKQRSFYCVLRLMVGHCSCHGLSPP